MAFIKLNRKGNIDTTLTAENQCKDIEWKHYAYEVGIVCNENNTDINDFVIDNSVVHRTIIDCFNTNMTSCEGMVKQVAQCLLEVCKAHGTEVLDMYIKIRPRLVEEFSYAWFEWSMSGKFA